MYVFAHKNKRKNIVIVAVFSAVFVSSLVWLKSIEGMGLMGEDRVETIVEQSSGKTLYVYEKSGVPDGFINARVALKYQYLPFEKTVATMDAPFQRAEQKNGVVVLWFGRAGSVRIDMDLGQVDRDE